MDEPKLSRWPMLRDGIIFQLKLGLDAGRDLLLSPISILCLIIDVIRGHTKEKSYFHRLMAFGLKTDYWINLFGSHSPSENEDLSPESNVDHLFAQVERVLKEQHKKGGLTTPAKSSTNRYGDTLANKEELPTEQQPSADRAESVDSRETP